jgi:acyl-coenzyme A thioesterase PaaI-like protein
MADRTGSAGFAQRLGAVAESAEDGDVPATSQLTVTYLRPGTPGPWR